MTCWRRERNLFENTRGNALLSLEDLEDVGQEAANKVEAAVKKEAEEALYDVLAAG